MDDPVHALALVFHVVGFTTWIGGLYGMGWLLVAREADKNDAFRTRIGELARSGGRIADVGAGLAIVGGVWLLSFAPAVYMRQPWLHAKLTLVVLLLGLHGFFRVKAKRAATGPAGQAQFKRAMLTVLALLGALIVAVAVFKPGTR
jgi:putative membrane protein